MTLLGKLATLDTRERRLLARAVVWIVAVRVGLRVLPYGRLSALVDRASKLGALDASPSIEEVRWALQAAARRLRGTQCLAWAIACHGLLGQAGFPSGLRIGVAKTREGRLRAHAWVECRGTALSWGDDQRAYALLEPVLGGDL